MLLGRTTKSQRRHVLGREDLLKGAERGATPMALL